MERYRANGLGTPIGRRDITGGHGASKADQAEGFSKLDAQSDAMPEYEFTDDGVTITQPRGLLHRPMGNADDKGTQRRNNDPKR